MRRWNRWLIVAFGAGLIWALRRPRELPEAVTPPPTEPAPPQAETAPPAPERAWVEPHYDGSCPLSHPVKLKASSSIYHVEGQRNYDRTNADRCYRTTADAEADGHRPSKI
ncbi:MAG: hypothetical protein GY929_07145 [Actinomycetia bacterium]|nr:hypothetical protein [Actinomycetes bacterium]